MMMSWFVDKFHPSALARAETQKRCRVPLGDYSRTLFGFGEVAVGVEPVALAASIVAA